MKLNWKQVISLLSAVVLLVGICLPVAADEPPYNDGKLDWGDEPPVIVTQPADVAVYNGEDAVVSLVAEGDGLTYEWFYKNAGATKFIAAIKFTGNSYTAEMDEKVDGRQVYCIITNEAGLSTQSDTVTLTMLPDPVDPVKIVEQPKTATYGKDGATVKVTVKAEGDGLKYAWYIKNAGATKYSKSSVTSATYSVKLSASSSDRRLYCIVTDQYGNEAKSNTVLVRRQATITKESATVAYAQNGKKATVKVTAAGDGLKYAWYVKNASAKKYSKSSITSATYSATMSDKVKGRKVYCIVTDKYGKKVQSKTFLLRMSATITTQPKSVKVALKKTAKLTVKAKGDGLKYTWYVKNAGAKKYSKSSVTKSTYSVKMTSKVNGRLVYCVVTDKYGKKVQTKTVKLSKK